MLRVVSVVALVVAVLGLTGCRNPIDQQVAKFKEIADILREVKDQPSMDDAERKIRSRAAHFEQLDREIKALKRDGALPDPTESQRSALQLAYQDMQKEVARIVRLPGGPEFFERFSNAMSEDRRAK